MMSAKKFSILVLLNLLGRCVAAQDLPATFNFARYEPMVKHSPFAVATAVAPQPTAASFAKDLFVANAAHSPDGDLVTIASLSDREFKKYLTTKAPVDGYSIASIEWSDKVGETRVTIGKDGQFATLTFNQALLTQPLPNAAPGPRPGQPPNQPPPVPPPPQMQSVQTPAPHVRGVIPRNPARAPGPPSPAQTPQSSDDDE